ncbi:hypothetical protein DTO207G8_8073 [Paecilomyces variotii]|nr:hypothetical protein DTO207G8_8073 [Paecilomyces variotii]KAJ9377994.1 hypothetical protein DTO063F5_8003 [Paecilomyces variotii]KAJ9408493.1 hypothetical protein DTO045G8_3786 [Paecilomyces variotii]
MGKKKNTHRELTHEEIWDDSALVRSWDEAVEEYKLYHSIHAKGENIEDVLRQAGASEDLDYGEDAQTAAAQVEPAMAVDDESEKPTEDFKSSSAQPSQGGEGQGMNPIPSGPNAMPEILLQGQDESLKNLIMAWYYAGYYTGLHEGQRRANQRNS